MDPQKRGSKNKTVDRAVSKKLPPPPPGPLINSSFWRHQKIRGKIVFSDFRVLNFWPIFPSFLFLVWFAHGKLSAKFLPRFQGCQRTGENKGFVELCRVFFNFICYILFFYFFHVVSLCSCFTSCTFIVANVWFVLAVLLVPFVFFLFSVTFLFVRGGVIHLFTLTKKQDQTTENPNMWNIVFDVLLWGLHPHTFTWPT